MGEPGNDVKRPEKINKYRWGKVSIKINQNNRLQYKQLQCSLKRFSDVVFSRNGLSIYILQAEYVDNTLHKLETKIKNIYQVKANRKAHAMWTRLQNENFKRNFPEITFL